MDPDSSEGSRCRALKEKYVRFQINEVYVPEPAQILTELHGYDWLQGRVVDLSDHGAERDAFAVVEVEALNERVIVPVARLVEVTQN
ncbi:MAG TPA: hypothetical protein VFV34_24155 [Blastocatellia bacterium]|nr:hypothetical protein [Blastocatellia bacterium]